MRWMRRADEHERLRLQLNDYIADALDERERRSIERHLETCAECRVEAEELRELRAALRAMPEVPAPRSFRLTPEMVGAPRAPVPIRPRQPAWIPRFAQIAAAVATVGFGAVLAIDVFGGSGSEESALAPISTLASEEMQANASDASAADASAAGAANDSASDYARSSATAGAEAWAEATEELNGQFAEATGSAEQGAAGAEADAPRDAGVTALPPDVALVPMPADEGDAADSDKRLLRSLEAVLACAAVGFVVLAMFARPRTKS